MRIMPFVAVVVLTGFAACSPEPAKTAKAADVFPSLPVPADAEVVSRAGSEEALQIVLRSQQSPDDIALYYRSIFTHAPWHLVSDQQSPDGSLTMYAESGGPPMWVTIRKAVGTNGTTIEISGAVATKPSHPDSGVRAPAASHPAS
jgi:hypothetical protein